MKNNHAVDNLHDRVMKMVTRDPESGEILTGYIYEDEAGERWEIPMPGNSMNPVDVLIAADHAINFFKGEKPVEELGRLIFKYSAYATPKAGRMYLNHHPATVAAAF